MFAIKFLLKMMESIDITPDRSLMVKLGNSGYSLDEAISELVDNSIDAMNPGELVIGINVTSEKISVIDDGKGMDKQEVIDSLRLGISKKENCLGKFGLGMKTACLSLGKNFFLETSRGDRKLFVINFSQDEWLRNGNWNNFPLEVKDYFISHGTKITVTNLNVNISEKEIVKLKNHLGMRFGLFIRDKKIKIFVNGELCSEKIPILIEEKRNEFELKLENGDIIRGWFGFQLAGSIKQNFGFHTYRNNRLITLFDKVGLSTNQKAKQIFGEIHLDSIPISHNKRGWMKESYEYKLFEKKFADFLKVYDKKLIKIVTGSCACPGRVSGRVVVLNSFEFGEGREKNFEELQEGDIIVTQMTRPDMLFYLQKAKAIITDFGGVLCHAAIVSREFNIPCIVGTENATTLLKTGQNVIVDASEGVVYYGE